MCKLNEKFVWKIKKMKLKRFQLALNSEDPLIVIKGLNEFNEIVLKENNQINNFGYYCRSLNYNSFKRNENENESEEKDNNSDNNNEINGLLLDYIQSSPQIEELFVLWKLTNRNNLNELIISHTKCITIILHCIKSDKKCCERIVTKILSEFTRSITNQLSQGNLDITHCTLGLLIAMCASTPQNARDTYNKLLVHLKPLQTLLQKGRNISTNINGQQIQTDSRLLVVILVLNVLYHCDVFIGNELITNKGLFNRVVNGMSKDSTYTVHQILHGSIEILNNPLLPISVKIGFIDITFLQKILAITNDQLLQIKTKLLETYCHILVEGSDRKKSGEINKANSPVSRMILLINTLHPHINLLHRKVIIIYF